MSNCVDGTSNLAFVIDTDATRTSGSLFSIKNGSNLKTYWDWNGDQYDPNGYKFIGIYSHQIFDVGANMAIDLSINGATTINGSPISMRDGSGLSAEFSGDKIMVPNIGTTNPNDGTNTIYMDAVTRILKVGT